MRLTLNVTQNSIYSLMFRTCIFKCVLRVSVAYLLSALGGMVFWTLLLGNYNCDLPISLRVSQYNIIALEQAKGGKDFYVFDVGEETFQAVSPWLTEDETCGQITHSDTLQRQNRNIPIL